MKKFKKGVLAIGVLAAAAVIAAGCGKKDAKIFASFFPQPAAITAAAANTPIANTPFLNFFIIIFSFYLSYFLRAFPAKKFPRLCMHCVIIISTTTSEYISVKLKRL